MAVWDRKWRFVSRCDREIETPLTLDSKSGKIVLPRGHDSRESPDGSQQEALVPIGIFFKTDAESIDATAREFDGNGCLKAALSFYRD